MATAAQRVVGPRQISHLTAPPLPGCYSIPFPSRLRHTQGGRGLDHVAHYTCKPTASRSRDRCRGRDGNAKTHFPNCRTVQVATAPTRGFQETKLLKYRAVCRCGPCLRGNPPRRRWERAKSPEFLRQVLGDLERRPFSSRTSGGGSTRALATPPPRPAARRPPPGEAVPGRGPALTMDK